MQAFNIFCVALLTLVVSKIKANFKPSGPYNLEFKKIIPCDIDGKVYSQFTAKMEKKGRYELSWNINWTLKEEFSNDVIAKVEVDSWGSAGWGNIYKHSSKNACTDALKRSAGAFQSMLKSAGLPQQCPVPKGNYVTTDLVVNNTIKDLPVMPYGRYRMYCKYYKLKKPVGCWLIYVNVLENTNKL